jgi:RNA polymerase sigma-70 factor, ECF subfamily
MTEDIDWRRTLERIRAGDVEAFGAIIGAHQSSVRCFLAVRLRNAADVDDLAQEVFITAYRRLASFRGDSSLATWLRGIARNHLANFSRKHRDRTVADRLSGILADDIDAIDEAHRADDLLVALRSCIAQLDERERRLLESRFVHGDEVSAIVSASGLKHSAVTMALHRLRHRLRACIFERRRTAIA